jgi:hypothetical protein
MNTNRRALYLKFFFLGLAAFMTTLVVLGAAFPPKGNDHYAKIAREVKPPQPKRGRVSYAQFDALPACFYPDVVKKIGWKGTLLSSGNGFDIYTWQNRDGSNMTLMFENGCLINKSQFGLR